MKNHTPGPWAYWWKSTETAAEPPSRGRVLGPPWQDLKEGSGYTNKDDCALMAEAPTLLAENARLQEEIASLRRSVFCWLGMNRDDIAPEAVEALQNIVGSIKEEAKN